jgi:hypothetical protein
VAENPETSSNKLFPTNRERKNEALIDRKKSGTTVVELHPGSAVRSENRVSEDLFAVRSLQQERR